MTQAAPNLYTDVQSKLAEARARVAQLDAADEVKAVALRRLRQLGRAARYDLSIASREVAAFLADLDEGVIPLYEN